MAEPLDPIELVTVEETVRMEMIISQALINVLVRKGLLTEQELLEEISQIKASLPQST
ncbi:MAG: hypothetical protein ABIN58_05150 [candidate division WOR-3 bacterium]